MVKKTTFYLLIFLIWAGIINQSFASSMSISALSRSLLPKAEVDARGKQQVKSKKTKKIKERRRKHRLKQSFKKEQKRYFKAKKRLRANKAARIWFWIIAATILLLVGFGWLLMAFSGFTFVQVLILYGILLLVLAAILVLFLLLWASKS